MYSFSHLRTPLAPAFGSSLRSGDMRKGGNTDLLCDEFAKGAIKGTKYLAQAYKLGLRVK